jgi:hypothetical protein
LEIPAFDNYLAEVVVAIDDLDARVNLIGLCRCLDGSGGCGAVPPPGQWAGLAGRGPIDNDAGLVDFSNFLQVPGTSSRFPN